MIPQSATSIHDFKTCPMLYRLRHILRLRPIDDPATARQGTNWHKCLEILTDPAGGEQAMIDHLNITYSNCPPSVELTDWEVERTVLLYSALGWLWYWRDDEIETLAREVHFERQINTLYSRRGMIDRIIRRNRQLLLGEYKSTSKPIDSSSLYWDRLNLDSQLTLYLLEARHAQLAGQLEQFGITATDPLISGVLYDVWHKPAIRPKKLTQADSKKFVADGKYFGEEFNCVLWIDAHRTDDNLHTRNLVVNGREAEITLGSIPKPTNKNPNPEIPFAIRETPEMFGARLLADIRENPGNHFARKEIARTDRELAILDAEYYNIARLAHMADQRDLWFRNENQCDATYRCSFYSICYYNLDVTNGIVTTGFKCLIKGIENAKAPQDAPETNAPQRPK